MKRIGFVGWRGMVGSVLMERMLAEKDFNQIDEPVFFTTSQIGEPGPDIGKDIPPLKDAHDLASLRELDAIVSCQGEVTPVQFLANFANQDGMATGSMRHQHCV